MRRAISIATSPPSAGSSRGSACCRPPARHRQSRLLPGRSRRDADPDPPRPHRRRHAGGGAASFRGAALRSAGLRRLRHAAAPIAAGPSSTCPPAASICATSTCRCGGGRADAPRAPVGAPAEPPPWRCGIAACAKPEAGNDTQVTSRACTPPTAHWMRQGNFEGLMPPINRLSLDRNGVIHWNGRQTSLPQLSEYLGIVHGMNPEPIVFLDTEMGAPCALLEAIRDEMDRRLEAARTAPAPRVSGPSGRQPRRLRAPHPLEHRIGVSRFYGRCRCTTISNPSSAVGGTK